MNSRFRFASLLLLSAGFGVAQTSPSEQSSVVKRVEKDVIDAVTPTSERVVPAQERPYKPATGADRLYWFIDSTVGFSSLFLAGPISAGWGTLLHSPEEYPPTWEGFGQRYGMRLTGVSTGNAITASLGAIWGEDPRYFRLEDGTFKQHVVQVLKGSVMSRYASGEYHFSYARMAGNVGNNFLSNTWRVPSESTPGQAALRCVYGVLGHMAGNAFTEFWPIVKKKAFKK
jgi:hypothetical protein